MFIFLFFILSSFCIFNAVLFKIKFEKSLPLNFFLIILILYFFALGGFLKYGVYGIWVISAGLLLASAFRFILSSEKKVLRTFIFTDGFFLFVAFFVFFVVHHYGRLFTSWDEFSHWGISIKSMYVLDDLSTNEYAHISFRSYPPGITLLEYFAMKTNGTFTEWLAYLMYDLLFVSLFIAFFDFEKIKKRRLRFISMLIVFFTLLGFRFILFDGSIYVDAMVAAFFAFGLLFIFTTDTFSKFDLAVLCSTISILPLLKDVGLFFAIILLIYFFIKQILLIKDKKITRAYFLMCIVCVLIAPLLTKGTWKLAVVNSGMPQRFSAPLNMKDALLAVFSKTGTYQDTVFKNFCKAFFKAELNSTARIDFSLFAFYSLGLFLLLFLRKYFQDKKIEFTCFVITAICTAAFYTFGLYLLYISRFSEYEAVRLASYSRYMSILILAYIVFFAVIFYKTLSTKKVLIGLAIFSFMTLTVPILKYPMQFAAKSTLANRQPYQEIAAKIDVSNTVSPKIAIVSQANTGYDGLVLAYELFPNTTAKYSLGPAKFDGDIWSRDISPNDWNTMLHAENYEYIIIFKSDEYFSENFRFLFADPAKIKDGSIFKINKTSGNYEFLK